MSSRFKAPPAMRDDLPYPEWKKELNIWCRFTDMAKQRQAGALFLTLTGKTRDAIRAKVDEDDIDSDDGVKSIIRALDELYLKDASQAGFAAFDEFIQYRRPANVKISEYLLEFNLKYNKIKSQSMKLPEGVLAYTLLKCANLPVEQEQICRATVAELTYLEMKKTIEKVVVINTRSEGVGEAEIIQPAPVCCASAEYEAGEYEDTYYSRPPYRRSYGTQPQSKPQSQQRTESGFRKPTLNPLDEYGNAQPCRFCHSVYHWINECPDAPPDQKSRRGRGRGRNGRSFRRPGRGSKDGNNEL